MAVKIRLQRAGRKKAPYYHIVIADARSPRDGRFIKKIGSYNPTTIPASIEIEKTEALEWLEKGAQPSDTVRRILSYKGVMYHKHLLRGIKKGVINQEKADAQWTEWEEKHRNSTLDAQKKGKAGVRQKKIKKTEAK